MRANVEIHSPEVARMLDLGVDAIGRQISYEAVTRWLGAPFGARLRPLLHFVGFKDDRYLNAIKAFGRPDFIHRHYDARAIAEIMPGDTVIFAEGDERQPVTPFAYDDSAHF